MSKDPSSFRRPVWDLFTATQITSARANERGVQSRDEMFPGPNGTIPVRSYCVVAGSQPQNSSNLVELVFFHGGGMVIQNEKSTEAHGLVVELVRRLGCRACSVGYRLAPEHPFPASLKDTYAVTKAIALHNPGAHLVLCGDSAGGNLALVLARLFKNGLDPDLKPDPDGQRVFARVAHLALLYPALYETDTPSHRSPSTRYLLSASTKLFMLNAYLGSDRDRLLKDFRVAPLTGSPEGFVGLPSVSLVSCALDPLKDENLMLARALGAAGVAVDHFHVEASPHGFLTFPWFAADSVRVERTLSCVVAAIQAATKGSLA